ncbi:uncharacterized protein ZK1307.1-like [Bolinopsis microptera]|uniref:uncharacterized protein ZK1307.1-like n=1 Tax=Bolinopsis microptera TaxID=2820187 RepID=UPI003079AD55
MSTQKITGAASKIYKRVMMVPPQHFDVIHKNLNAHMSCSKPVNKVKAVSQWQALRETFNNLGLHTDICPAAPGEVDMVFAANSAIVLNNKALIAKMAVEPRRTESAHFANWFRNQGFEVEELEKIGKPYMFCEGNAEFSPTHDLSRYFFGWGQRTAESSYELVLDFFSLDKKDAFKVRLIDERFYHLDVSMAPLSLGHVMLYPGAFDEASLKNVYDALGSRDKVIELTLEEGLQFSCNCVSFISNDLEAVVVAPHFSDRLGNVLQDLGYKCVQIDYDQFLLSGGAVRCCVVDIAQTRDV